MSKLISQGGFGCVYYPGFDTKGKPIVDEDVVVKLQHKSIASQNEVDISKTIMEIPYFKFYFAPILKSQPIQIGEISNTLVKSCKPVNKSTSSDFTLMTIPYVNQENYFQSIVNADQNDTRHIFTQYIDSYTFLLTSLELLAKKKILHFDIKDDNIVYSRENRNPIIIDFGISIPIDKLNANTWHKHFYVYAIEYYIWCLEIHFISYLCHEQDTLDKDSVASICKDYVNHCPVFSFFSTDFKSKYIEGATQHYMQYVDMDKDEIIKSLLETWETWDNYSLSILNLRVLTYLFSNEFIQNPTISYLIELYTQNIHFDGKQRYSLKDTKIKYKQLFVQESDLDNLYYLVNYIQPKRHLVKQQIKEQKLDRSSYKLKDNK